MAIIATNKGGTHDPVSEGVHIAVCTRIIDLGDQYSEIFGKWSRKAMICWEVDETIVIDGKDTHRMISKDYTLSLSEKATLRSHLESWRSKKFTDDELRGFDLKNVLSKPCQLQILHNKNGYATVSAIMAMPKATPAPVPTTELIYFDLGDASCLNMFDKLPEWIKDKIKASPQYKELIKTQIDNSDSDFGVISDGIDDEDLPF